MAMDNQFWLGLLEILGVNIVLSGDNAVVIAMAARSLPRRQQRAAIILGSGAAIVLRVILTTVAASVLEQPYLKLAGALLLLWIGIQLMLPHEKDGGSVGQASHLAAAVRTILVADLVMSLDNVIAVAAAAHGNFLLLTLGLAISIPLIIFGSTALLKLMDRFPFIINLGAGLLGYVAGEMLLSEPILDAYAQGPLVHLAIPWSGAFVVLVAGTWISSRIAAKRRRNAVGGEPR
jgi:YjbE family integral membrane protein